MSDTTKVENRWIVSGTDKPFCLEVSRNGQFCAGADWYLSEIQRLQAEVKRLEAESSELYRQKEFEIGRANWAEGRAESAEAALSEIRALPDEWEKEGPCEEWAGLNDAAQQLRKILEKYDA